jgi:GntR family transcriptional regulator
MLFLKPNPSSGIPIYLQLKGQIRHAVETGALRPGDALPGIRALAERLVMNPNTVARVYRELEQEGLVELRHGVGAFIALDGAATDRAEAVRAAIPLVAELVARLRADGLDADEIRRLVEAELNAPASSDVIASPGAAGIGSRGNRLRLSPDSSG